MAGQFLDTAKLKSLLIDQFLWDKIHTELNPESGVYIFHLANEKYPTAINRFLGIDYEGILYIGKANSFKERIIDAKKSIIYKSNGHEFGMRYYEFEDRILQSYQNSKIFCSLIPDTNPAEKEKILLKLYLITFGELPPFNRNKP